MFYPEQVQDEGCGYPFRYLGMKEEGSQEGLSDEGNEGDEGDEDNEMNKWNTFEYSPSLEYLLNPLNFYKVTKTE